MRIAYIAGAGVPSPSANSIHVMRMCEAMAQNGHDVQLIVPQRNSVSEDDAFTYYGVAPLFRIRHVQRMPFKGRTYGFAIAAALAARRFEADLVYCRSVHAAYFVSLCGLPIVLESHSPIRDKGRIADWMFRRVAAAGTFQRLVVITRALAAHYREKHPALAARMIVAPDAGCEEVVGSKGAGRIASRGARLRVGYIGSLFSGKCMEVVEPVARSWSGADFHIVGGADDDVELWRARMSSCAHIHFHGRRPPAEAASYIESFDVALLPNQFRVALGDHGADFGRWTSPLKLFEYMAAGRAIVASDLPVLREVLRDGENCLLCDPTAPDEWVEALQRLAGDSRLRSRLGANARSEFLEHYTWRKRAQRALGGLDAIS